MLRHYLVILLLISLLASSQPVLAQAATGPVYIVQSGDTLLSIAVRFNVTLADLMSANDISDPNLLAAGQELIIPGLEGVSGVLVTEVIQFGDSYKNLSRRTQVPEVLLRKLNRLVSPTELYVGISLVVPQQETAENLSSRITPSTGESLLELAVKQGEHPWSLATINGLQGRWDALPGEVLYATGNDSGQEANGLPAVFTAASVEVLPLKQGGTAVIRVNLPTGVVIGGRLGDRTLQFFPDTGNSLVALHGVHVMLEPGPYPLRLDATLPDGSMQSFEQMVLVMSGNYQREDLYVESSTIDPAVTEPENEQIISLTNNAIGEKFWSGAFISPAVYPDCFTSRYGTRRTYFGVNTNTEIQGFHTGLDFCGGEGLQIASPAAGKVVFAGPLAVRGNATLIDHGWGVFSGFWHQSEIKVEVGEMVEPGQVIGLVGGTGRVTGAHLHWEVWVNGVQVDPLDWLNQAFP